MTTQNDNFMYGIIEENEAASTSTLSDADYNEVNLMMAELQHMVEVNDQIVHRLLDKLARLKGNRRHG